jgi:hypothetical protein
VAALLSQLSAVTYTPDKEKPMITRSTIQAYGSVSTGYAISTAEISDPSAAKTRTWPTRAMNFGAMREPPRKPTK